MRVLLKNPIRFSALRSGLLGLTVTTGVVYAATQIVVSTPIAVSDGVNGDKPKIQRASNGMLVTVYGDSPVDAQEVYDVKAGRDRKARDIFVKTCAPGKFRSCDERAHWSAATNISDSALKSSISTDWRGTLGEPEPYSGDIDKPNMKTSGPVMVVTWVSKYCPDGDLVTPGIQPSVQRAIKYLERANRVIPFSCTWLAYSTDSGGTWASPIQLSTGLRDAIQDSNNGSFNNETKKGQVNITWQEDPQGLLLGEGDGPGDGASGAGTHGGTDIWYAYATIDLAAPNTSNDDFVLAPPVRLTDNWEGGYGTDNLLNPVLDGAGSLVNNALLETGTAAASRPNVAMIGSTALVAYEETKNSPLPTVQGKFVRYHAFDFRKPTHNAGDANSNNPAGCVISDHLKNARRVRVLTQSPDDAGTAGMQLAIFWREGAYNTGGPADIALRRGIGGVRPVNLVPAIDAGCFASDYATVRTLNSERAENVSSNTPTATSINLSDDTETYNAENALAHRGVLRGSELWIGYSYTSDMTKLWAQQGNYDFWLRKYTLSNGWSSPTNLTNITDLNINVREPRIFGTPKSSPTACPTGNPVDPTTTDATLCQNTSIVYLAWGTQTNVAPTDTAGPEDLGIYIAASTDGGKSFLTPIRYSAAMGTLFQDDEAAYESQVVTRPDGTRFYGVWNQVDLVGNTTVAEYASGDLFTPPVPPPPEPTPLPLSASGGGCSMSMSGTPLDPTLLLLTAVGFFGVALSRIRRN